MIWANIRGGQAFRDPLGAQIAWIRRLSGGRWSWSTRSQQGTAPSRREAKEGAEEAIRIELRNRIRSLRAIKASVMSLPCPKAGRKKSLLDHL